MIDVLNVTFAVSLLFLVASGLAIIFGLMKVINLAHGDFLMLGAFATLWTTQHAGFWLALLVAPGLVACFSLFVEVGLIRRLYRRPLETILATWGLGIVIREAMNLGVGPQRREVASPMLGPVDVLGTNYPAYQLAMIGIVLLLVLGLVLLMRFTRFGLMTRAVIENPDLAAAYGTNVGGTYRIAFAVGSALAGFAGALVAPLVSIYPEMGPGFVINGFLAVIVGGSGSLVGGLGASSTLLGISQSLASRVLSPVAGNVLLLVLAVILMRVRPRGLSVGRG